MTVSIVQAASQAQASAPDRELNVLILDDLETDRVRVRRLLRKAGLEFSLFEAQDLASFKKQIDAHQMDLVFLDYHLEMDTGLDALKVLSAHEDQVEALPIMITSVDRTDIAVEAMRNGCADYLIKEQLSVEAVRKSVTSAFERKILISALNEAHTSRHAARAGIQRFARTCGPEIRSVLSATLRHSRSMRNNELVPTPFAENLGKLESSCRQIFQFLETTAEFMEGMDRPRENAKQVDAAG